MEIRHLRYFEALAATLNFSHAAQRLHVAQPELSRQIQQLENELGVALVDRSTRPIKLTEAGQFFYDQTLQLLSRVQQTVESTRRIGEGKRRRLSVGFVPSMLYGLIPQILREFSEAHDNLDVALVELTSLQQVRALQDGSIDIAFSRLSLANDGILHQVIDEEPVVAVMSVASALAKKKSLAMAELVKHTVVLYPAQPRPSFADEVLRHFRAHGHAVRHLQEANGLQTAIGLVAAGAGVSLVPASVQRLQRDDVAYRPLAETNVTSIVVMSSRSNDTSPLLAELRQAMIDAYRRQRSLRRPAAGKPRLRAAAD